MCSLGERLRQKHQLALSQPLAAVRTEPSHVHPLSDVRLLAALLDWNRLVDNFSAVRATANRWVGVAVVGVETTVLLRNHLTLILLLIGLSRIAHDDEPSCISST